MSATGIRLLFLAAVLASAAVATAAEGDDVAAAINRARSGGALRVVAFGGSITLGGEGWIAPWLRQRLPGVQVSLRNAGWGATNSELGTFRLARDVLANDPDLVLIEFAVNDWMLSDTEAVRCVESLVARLAHLPHRPGIVLVLAADRNGPNHARHRAVAAHYGLLCVDMQAAMAAHAAAGGRLDDCFVDSIHLRPAGNAVYARALEAALEPLLDRPAAVWPPLPAAPLSRLPLRLDGRLVAPGPAPGWTIRRQGEWRDSDVLGSVEGHDPAQPLVVPVRGSDLGIYVDFGGGRDRGTLLATVDGGMPVEIASHLTVGGTALLVGRDLPPGEHLLTLAVASWRPGPVRVSHILAAGGGEAPVPKPGPWPAARLATIASVPGSAFRIAGPVVADDAAGLPGEALAYAGASVPGPAGAVAVRTGDASPRLVFATAAPWTGVAVAATRIHADRDREVLLGWAADYFGHVRVNGVEAIRFTGNHGDPGAHAFVVVQLRAGWNDIIITALPGSRGFACDLVLEQPAGVTSGRFGAAGWEMP